eukprot:372884-Amphidinium_carterae.1
MIGSKGHHATSHFPACYDQALKLCSKQPIKKSPPLPATSCRAMQGTSCAGIGASPSHRPKGKSTGKGSHKGQASSPIVRKVRIPEAKSSSTRPSSSPAAPTSEDATKGSARLVSLPDLAYVGLCLDMECFVAPPLRPQRPADNLFSMWWQYRNVMAQLRKLRPCYLPPTITGGVVLRVSAAYMRKFGAAHEVVIVLGRVLALELDLQSAERSIVLVAMHIQVGEGWTWAGIARATSDY